MHIKKDDMVQVITGNDAGTIARVLRVLPDKGKVVVEGVNRVYRHMKPNRRNAQGGRLQKEMPIAASNVLLYCTTCGHGVRIRKHYTEDGRKERRCKGGDHPLGSLSKPRATYTKAARDQREQRKREGEK
jgi:large subunit ribosomal protein L24